MRQRLKFEQIIQSTPRLVLTELIDPRSESRVRIDRFLTRNLIRPHNRVICSKLVARVFGVSSRFRSQFVTVLASLLTESIGIVVTG